MEQPDAAQTRTRLRLGSPTQMDQKPCNFSWRMAFRPRLAWRQPLTPLIYMGLGAACQLLCSAAKRISNGPGKKIAPGFQRVFPAKPLGHAVRRPGRGEIDEFRQ